ncbi:MAG: TonB-dependent receptor, partial [Marinilabiliales bacterium]
MMKFSAYLWLVLFFLAGFVSNAQEKVTVKGIVRNEAGIPVELVNITVLGFSGTTSDFNGKYLIEIPANKSYAFVFSHLEYKNDTVWVKGKPGEIVRLDKRMERGALMLKGVTIEDQYERANSISRIPTKTIKVIPSAAQGIESLLIGQLGVAKGGGELSSQYSVRGGNFDENLVYVNDIEVYRPFLVRSGQQEGLSFTNPDMVSSVLFSAGGFEAKYGDKMSSVLDIKYRKPNEFAGTVSASLLGGSAHIEGSSDNHRFTHITGFRYKTSKYMLNSLDTKGEYNPSFYDFQTYLTYDVNTNFELSFLANIAQNKYTFVPETLETAFGTWNEALNLKIYFDGHEMDKFSSVTGAVSGNYHPSKNRSFKFIASGYQTQEVETYDIQGQYFINELDKDMGSDSFGDSLMNIGIGTFLNHARNYLNARIFNLSHKALIANEDESNILMWGVSYKHEIVSDEINEWQMLDSSGYSLPYSDTAVNLYRTLVSNNAIESDRLTAYIQDAHNFILDSSEINLTIGIRAHYWTLNKQFITSPRINLAYKPNWERDILLRIAAGYYYQPPFYKELRDLDGNIHTDVKAQKSFHIVAGSDLNFLLWGRPFKFIAEAYYKKL